MSRVNFTTGRSVEYFMLVEPRPEGPVVGYYAGRPIVAAVLDHVVAALLMRESPRVFATADMTWTLCGRVSGSSSRD